jgi:hypothetical protein
MLQVQSLINQRALSAPSGSTPKEESKPAQKEDIKPKSRTEGQKNDIKTAQQKTQIEKICKNCSQPFYTENPRKETCSDKCRAAYSRKKKNMEE